MGQGGDREEGTRLEVESKSFDSYLLSSVLDIHFCRMRGVQEESSGVRGGTAQVRSVQERRLLFQGVPEAALAFS